MVTLADVAATLPADVRDTVALTLPCPSYRRGGHRWTWHCWEVGVYGSAFYEVCPYWYCMGCGITHPVDPRPMLEGLR